MKATMVAANQPASEMISARRRSSRCSTMDMRASSGAFVDLRRPLCSRAMPDCLALLVGLGLQLDGRGGAGGRLLLVDRRLHLFGDLVGRLPELADPATDGATELGQLARPEDDEHDRQKDDQ